MSDNLHAGSTDGKLDMLKDPIVEEVRYTREREAAKHGFDVKKILLASKKRQQRSKHKIVHLAPKKKLGA